MAHFNFENMLNEVTKMDAPLQGGPMMRWQKKAAEAGINKLAVPGEQGGPLSPWKPRSASAKTPKTPSSSKVTKTPGKKTPGKGLQNKAPTKTPSKTPGKQGQHDRFIPNRATTDMDLGHYAIMHDKEDEDSPSKAQYKQHLHDALNKGQNPQDAKVLSFKDKAPKAKEGHINSLKVLYSCGRVSSGPKAPTTRQIPQQPDRILDAPELVDDYYLNLLDWSVNNHLAVALGGAVYLWNASSGTISQLCEMSSTDDYISGVSWIKEGNIIAIGTNSGNIQLWDAGQQKLVRTMTGHAARVASMSWNTYILSSGSRTGVIRHDDVRVADHAVAHLNSHTQEVCGLSWSPDGKLLASGGNDNVLNIWDTSLGDENTPLHTFTHHQAAVKALAWCPWQPQLLASGGGTADRNIRIWNSATGTCLSATDTNSQVCSILWSKEYKELISGHGYSQNQLTIWKYPAMTKVADLSGHTARVLCLTMSPDGTTVASAAADETIRLWKCFAVDKTKSKSAPKPTKDTSSSLSLMNRGIR